MRAQLRGNERQCRALEAVEVQQFQVQDEEQEGSEGDCRKGEYD
jgi:hypothetical protein